MHFGYISYFVKFHLFVLINLYKWLNYIKLKSCGTVLLNIVLIYFMDGLVEHFTGLDNLFPSLMFYLAYV